MKFAQMSIIILVSCLLAMPALAFQADKLKLKGNMSITYKKLPPAAGNIKEAFTKGMLYGRFRTNVFYFLKFPIFMLQSAPGRRWCETDKFNKYR